MLALARSLAKRAEQEAGCRLHASCVHLAPLLLDRPIGIHANEPCGLAPLR